MRTVKQRLILKVLILFLVPPLIGIVGASVLTGNYRRAELLAEADRELADHVTVLRATLPRLVAGMEPPQRAQLLEALARYERVHGIALYDRSCRVIVRSPDLDAAAAALDGMVCEGQRARGEQHRVVWLGERELLLRAEPFADGSQLGALAVTYDLAAVHSMIESGSRRLLLLGAVLALVMSAMAVLVARNMGRALGALVQAAERVATGDLSVQVSPPNFLELRRVGVAFNQMVRGLEQARRRLEAAEEQRRELDQRLLHAQALRAVGQVAASLAHEVASPLSTILGWSRLAASDTGLPPTFREQAPVMADQCERITRILQRLLAVSRPSEFAREPVQLTEVAKDVAQFLSIESRARGITVRLELGRDVPPVLGERDRCFQLLINLALNAIQAQKRGGLVVLAVASVPGSSDGGPGVRVEVRDAGPGIPESEYEHIFEPFYTTKGPGHGLGLPIARDLARKLGGPLEVARAPEGGACFRVFLRTDSEPA
jgi:signal transduction histidine kinase